MSVRTNDYVASYGKRGELNIYLIVAVCRCTPSPRSDPHCNAASKKKKIELKINPKRERKKMCRQFLAHNYGGSKGKGRASKE